MMGISNSVAEYLVDTVILIVSLYTCSICKLCTDIQNYSAQELGLFPYLPLGGNIHGMILFIITFGKIYF